MEEVSPPTGSERGEGARRAAPPTQNKVGKRQRNGGVGTEAGIDDATDEVHFPGLVAWDALLS